jgi:isopentenyl diphosphate isomerase/L-lactate dehydrogenase-like FMN-dependent dehydrogenase
LHSLLAALEEEIRVALAQLGLRTIRDVGPNQLAQPEAPLA